MVVEDVVASALESTADLIASARFAVERRIAPGLPPAMGDPAAVSQCLQNLVTNALKYGQAGRWIGIQARTAEGVGGPEIQVSVSDRGIGIERSELGRIFEPFYRSPSPQTARIRGTGLGLSVAKRLAEAMKGRLTVTSVPGQESTFTLHLPVAETDVVSARPAPTA
jgi:signal transduction histidine kinase